MGLAMDTTWNEALELLVSVIVVFFLALLLGNALFP